MNGTQASVASTWALWLRWVVATTIGVLVAFAGFVVLFEIIGEPSHLLFPVLMTAVGSVVGAFQQRVVRRALGESTKWALATGVGFGAGIGLAFAIGEGRGLSGKIVAGLVHGAALGAIVGTLQWRVLKARVPAARWWVVVSIGGWAIAAAVADAAGYFVDGIDIVVAPVVAAGVTGVALARLARSGGPSRPEPGESGRPERSTSTSLGRSARRRGSLPTPATMLSIATVLVAALAACTDDSSTTGSAAPGSVSATSDLCALVSEMYEQDGLPTVEQLQRYRTLAPDEIADPVDQVAERLIAGAADPVAFFKIIAADDNEAAIARIDAWEEATCGIPHSQDAPQPAGASRELEPAAARVDVHTSDYAFHLGGVSPGRTSFVLTNDGDEAHELLIVKLADGATLDQALQAEGGEGTTEEEWTTNIAAPGGDDEVVTFDVEPGNYGLVCFILSADGTPHALLGMQHELTVT